MRIFFGKRGCSCGYVVACRTRLGVNVFGHSKEFFQRPDVVIQIYVSICVVTLMPEEEAFVGYNQSSVRESVDNGVVHDRNMSW
jgi:hypothetical protein